jgi:hypothetical protein
MEVAMNYKMAIMVLDGSQLSKTILQALSTRKENPKTQDSVELGQSKEQIL